MLNAPTALKLTSFSLSMWQDEMTNSPRKMNILKKGSLATHSELHSITRLQPWVSLL